MPGLASPGIFTHPSAAWTEMTQRLGSPGPGAPASGSSVLLREDLLTPAFSQDLNSLSRLLSQRKEVEAARPLQAWAQKSQNISFPTSHQGKTRVKGILKS